MYDLLFYLSLCLINNEKYFYYLKDYNNLNKDKKNILKKQINFIYQKKKFDKKILLFFKNLIKYIDFYYKKLNIDILFFIKQKEIITNIFIYGLLNDKSIIITDKYKIITCYILFYYKFYKILIPFNYNIKNKVNYIELFHKDILNINSYFKNTYITKNILNCYFNKGKLSFYKKNRNFSNIIIHFHILDITNVFNFLTIEIMKIIYQYKINIFITFCNKVNNLKNFFKKDDVKNNYPKNFFKKLYKNNLIILLNIINHGMDIGPKLILTEFLKVNKINYNHIIFIHSKSNSTLYNFFSNSIFNNIKTIIKTIENNKHINYNFFPISLMYGYNNLIFDNNFFFNDTFSDIDFTKSFPNYKHNYCLIKSFLKYFYNIDLHDINNKHLFFDGNFYVLHKNVCNKIFNYKKMYHLLNNIFSYEYNWFNINYSFNYNLFESYYFYFINKNKFDGNLLKNNKNNKLRDYMVEHIYERVILYILKNIKNNYVKLLIPNYLNNNILLKKLKINIENTINN